MPDPNVNQDNAGIKLLDKVAREVATVLGISNASKDVLRIIGGNYNFVEDMTIRCLVAYYASVGLGITVDPSAGYYMSIIKCITYYAVLVLSSIFIRRSTNIPRHTGHFSKASRHALENDITLNNKLVALVISATVLTSLYGFAWSIFGLWKFIGWIVFVISLLILMVMSISFLENTFHLVGHLTGYSSTRCLARVMILPYRIVIYVLRTLHLISWTTRRRTLGAPSEANLLSLDQKVVCSSCGQGELLNWPRLDRPWVEHCPACGWGQATWDPLPKESGNGSRPTLGPQRILFVTANAADAARTPLGRAGEGAIAIGREKAVTVHARVHPATDGRVWVGDYDWVVAVWPSRPPANPLFRTADDLLFLYECVVLPRNGDRSSFGRLLQERSKTASSLLNGRLGRWLLAVATGLRFIFTDPLPSGIRKWRDAVDPRLAVLGAPAVVDVGGQAPGFARLDSLDDLLNDLKPPVKEEAREPETVPA
jgi:hypothetical protein